MMVRPHTAAVATAMALNASPFERIDSDAEDAFWRESYPDLLYYNPKQDYAQFAPAYRLGYEGRQRYRCSFESAEPWLRREWDSRRGVSTLGWSQARVATRDAWERVERLSHGSLLRDGL